jgi:hypothetical protein
MKKMYYNCAVYYKNSQFKTLFARFAYFHKRTKDPQGMIFTVTLTTKYQNKIFYEIYKKKEGKFKKVMQCMPEDLCLTFPLDLVPKN